MGGFYSTLYGYFYSSSSTLTPLQVKNAVRRLSHALRLKQQKLRNDYTKKQAQILKGFSKTQKFRTKEVEKTFLDAQILDAYKFAVYEELIYSCGKIEKEAEVIAQNSSKMSNEAFLALCNLIHTYDDLQLHEIVNLDDFVPTPRPVISQKQLSEALRAYLQPKEPNEYQRNLYVIELLDRNKNEAKVLGVDLEVISKLGHKFEINPPQPPKETWSSAMYAVDFDELKQEEQEFFQEQNLLSNIQVPEENQKQSSQNKERLPARKEQMSRSRENLQEETAYF